MLAQTTHKVGKALGNASRKRVLITGGAGFIGSHVVDALLAEGFAPHVVDNLSSGRRENLRPGVPFYQVDICDPAGLTAVFAEVQPQWVSHHAAQISVSRSVREPIFDAEVNLLGLLRVLEASVAAGVKRVVFASSGGTLYGDVFESAGEDWPLQPVAPYAIAKLAGEHYLRFFAAEHGLQAVALRYGNVYGPRQDPHGEAGVVAIFAEKLVRGQPATINGDGRYVRDYVYVKDVARANLLALTAALEEGFTALNIGTGVGTDVNEIELLIRRLAGQARTARGMAGALPEPNRGAPRPGDLRSIMLASDRAGAVLGWTPRVDLAEGLQMTVEWFAERALGAGSGRRVQ